MRINYNVTGADRKALVRAMVELLGEPAVYQGAPLRRTLAPVFLHHPHWLPERGLRPADSAAGRNQVNGGTAKTTVNP